MFWELILIPLVALAASFLTFVSGFGLGTILTPVFAIFFPVEIAITLAAIIHFLNNIFKFILIGKNTNPGIFLRFGGASFIGAIAGSGLLVLISTSDLDFSFSIVGKTIATNVLQFSIGLLIILFAFMELLPSLRKIQFGKAGFIAGGLLSGFFGGISGHQGALRSAFLIKYGLTKEQFIATGISIALVVDVARLSLYGMNFFTVSLGENLPLMMLAVIAAFTGAFIGRRMLKKITLRYVELTVGIFLIILGLLIAAGIV